MSRRLEDLPAEVQAIISKSARKSGVDPAAVFKPYRKITPIEREARDRAIGQLANIVRRGEWRYRLGEIGSFFGLTRLAVETARRRSGLFQAR